MSLQLSSCDIAVVLSSIQNLKDPDDITLFSSLDPALPQMIYSYRDRPLLYFARGGKLPAFSLSTSLGRESASESLTFPIAVTCCGSRRNMHAYVSLLTPRRHMAIVNVVCRLYVLFFYENLNK